MKITKYAGHTCVRCKLLDKVLTHLKLDDIVETIYAEDVGEDTLIKMGIMSLPTLVIEKDGETKTLSGNILPQDIIDFIS